MIDFVEGKERRGVMLQHGITTAVVSCISSLWLLFKFNSMWPSFVNIYFMLNKNFDQAMQKLFSTNNFENNVQKGVEFSTKVG